MKQRRRELEGMLGTFALTKAQRFMLRKPPIKAEEFGRRLGALIYRVSKKHRERAMRNLRLAYPEMSETERQALALRTFEHYGRMTSDFLTGAKRTKEELDVSLTITGLHHLDDGLAKGRGVLLITGHFGNWERLASWMSYHGYPLSVVIRSANNPKLDSLVNELRGNAGTRVIPRGTAARPIIERLRANEIVGILPDQNTDEIYVPFFGHPAGTVLGPGVLQERTKAVVIPCYCIWTGPQKYEVVIDPPLEPQPGYETKGEGMIRAINDWLESAIRKHPEQWLWFHDRWKNARRKGLVP